MDIWEDLVFLRVALTLTPMKYLVGPPREFFENCQPLGNFLCFSETDPTYPILTFKQGYR